MDQLAGLTRLSGYRWTPADITSRVWSFGPIDQSPYDRYVRLLPDGRIGGHLGPNETGWRLEDGSLLFVDQRDRCTTRFDRVYIDSDGRLALEGEFLLPRGLARHVLREVEPGGGMAENGPELIVNHRRSPRRNLIVLRANEGSLHPQWPRDVADEDRSWDLCISFYGARENFGQDEFAEYQAHHKGMKLEALHQVMHRGSPLWNYDYIAFPDDDLMVSWGDWNELFAICRRFGLELAQPSLDPAGVHIAHPITRRDDKFLLRYVSFIEIMAPIFSRSALSACIGTFRETISGYGADSVWPQLIGERPGALAIIDKVSVLHTRPPGANYDGEAAIREGNQLQHRYDAPSRVVEYGGIRANPRDRQIWAPPAPDELW